MIDCGVLTVLAHAVLVSFAFRVCRFLSLSKNFLVGVDTLNKQE